jgi:hypothetical protein
MALKVFAIDPGESTDSSMFFDLNGQDYEIYKDPTVDQEYDVSVYTGEPNLDHIKTKLKLELCIFHNHENQLRFGYSSPPGATRSSGGSIIVTNAVDPTVADYKWVIHNDFLFNRTKAYYLNYPFNPTTKLWYYVGDLGYRLPEIKDSSAKTKIYIAPNNTYLNNPLRRIMYRPQLVNILKNQYGHLGFIGNHDDDKDLILHSQFEFPFAQTIEELVNVKHHVKYGAWGYNPINNQYYYNTFISIYGETIEHGSTIAITEKTYEPFIKGLFVLPFSTNGFIAYVRSQGWQLPDFIDYSYDNIEDVEERFLAYCDELHRLLAMPLETWRQHWDNNIGILKYNRELFFQRPYDRVDLTKYL